MEKDFKNKTKEKPRIILHIKTLNIEIPVEQLRS